MSKIFLDDLRNPPDDSWQIARTYLQAIYALGLYFESLEVISLDNDLGEEKEGYDVLCFIEKIYDGFHPPFEIRIHTKNTEAERKMKACIAAMKRRGYKSLTMPSEVADLLAIFDTLKES